MRIKTENVEESIEPVDVDKAGSEASEEGTDGLSKMFAVLGYSKVGVYRSVHISTRGFVSAQYKCTEFLDPVNIGICPEKIYTELIIHIFCAAVQLIQGKCLPTYPQNHEFCSAGIVDIKVLLFVCLG